MILSVFDQPHPPYDEIFIMIIERWKEIQIRRALSLSHFFPLARTLYAPQTYIFLP